MAAGGSRVRAWTNSDPIDTAWRGRHADDAESSFSFRAEMQEKNIRGGAQVLLFLTVAFTIGQFARYGSQILQALACEGSVWQDVPRAPQIWTLRAIEHFVNLLCVAALLRTIRQPRLCCYMLVVIWWYLYLLSLRLHELLGTCFLGAALQKCSGSANWSTNDCKTEDSASLLTSAAWIIISPRVVPTARLMHMTWLWIWLCVLPLQAFIAIEMDHDIQLWDAFRSCVILTAAGCYAYSKKLYMEKSQRQKVSVDTKRREVSERMFHILGYMMPQHIIVPMLRNPSHSIAEQYEQASVLFIMFENFEKIVHRYVDQPEEVLEYLNRYFTLFDHICRAHDVLKVETVGEEFVAAVGVTPRDTAFQSMNGHSEILARLVLAAWAILEVAATSGEQVLLKMGLHTGPIVAGVIGQKLPRFRLFGDTVNTAARMMQKGESGFVQFGEATRAHLPFWVSVSEPRFVEMKGKGLVTTYILTGIQFQKVGEERSPRSAFLPRADAERLPLRPATASSISDSSKTVPRKSLRPTVAQALFDGNDFAAEAVASAQEADDDPEDAGSRVRLSTLLESARARIRTSSFDPTLSASTAASTSWSPKASRRSARSSRRTVVQDASGFEVELSQLPASASRPCAGDLAVPINSCQGDASPKMSDEEELRAGTSIEAYSSPSGDAVVAPWTLSRAGSHLPPEGWYDLPPAALPCGSDNASGRPLFEQTVKEVIEEAMDGRQHAPSRSVWTFRRVLPADGEVPLEQEGDFQEWYHRHAVAKKLGKRMQRIALFLSLLTTVELAYVVLNTDVFLEDQASESMMRRLPTYLAGRLLVFCMLSYWSHTGFSEQAWVLENSRTVQLRLLATFSFIGLMLFVSYDAVATLPLHEDVVAAGERRLSSVKQQSVTSLCSFSAMFLFTFFAICMQFPFLFAHSCAFVGLTGLIIWRMNPHKGDLDQTRVLPLASNLVFSGTSKAVFFGCSLVQSFMAHSNEAVWRSRFRAKAQMEEMHERITSILNTLMPPMVVAQLRSCGPGAFSRLPSHRFESATIAQSDLIGFTQLASKKSPQEVVKFISEVFGRFDALTDKHRVYKVETVGDAYIAGQADRPLTLENSPLDVVLFALDMVKATHHWSRRRGQRVSCRVGVHHGFVIGGIVGTEMQRYHLFGEMMTVVEVLESTAPEGGVQASAACRCAILEQMEEFQVPQQLALFIEREDKFLRTSKDEVHHYDEVGGRTFLVQSYGHGGLGHHARS